MHPHKHSSVPMVLLLFGLLTSLVACDLPMQPNPASTYPPRPTIIWPSVTPSPTVTVTPTPEPSPTFTPTPIATETPVATPTLTPTPLSLDLQLDVFEDLWRVINNTYVYPDFNGVDWDAVNSEFRQRIEAGLDNAGFYQARYEMSTRLGDEHSFYLGP